MVATTKITQPENSCMKPSAAPGSDVVRHDGGDHDPHAVADDGQRHHGKHQEPAHGNAALNHISVTRSQGQQRHQRTNAAARFHHLQPHAGQDQHIAFAHDGEEVQRVSSVPGGELRGDELQREDDLVVDHRRHGNGEQQERDGEGHRAQDLRRRRSKRSVRRWQPTNDKTRQRKFRAQAAEKQHGRARTARSTIPQAEERAGNQAELVAPCPDQVRRQHGDEEAVGVVGIVIPLPDQQLEDGSIEQNERRSQQQSLPAEWL